MGSFTIGTDRHLGAAPPAVGKAYRSRQPWDRYDKFLEALPPTVIIGASCGRGFRKMGA